MLLRNYYNILATVIMQTSNKEQTLSYVNINGESVALKESSYADAIIFGVQRSTVNPYLGRCTTNYTSSGGVVFGDGDSPVAIDNHVLSGNLLTGFSYSASVSNEYDGDGVLTVRALYTITNTSGADMTIKEIGLFSRAGAYCLLDRTVLDSPVTIPAGGVGQITYTIRMNHPTV